MGVVLLRLTALCMLTALSEQMAENSPVRGGVYLIGGLIAAEMILEMVLALPGALFSVR